MDYCVLVRICCNLFQRKTENFMKENLRSFSFRSLSNKSIKSITNYRNRSKSIITKTRVIDFYRFPIVIDWLVSITIDYVRFLSSIENIDLLRPVVFGGSRSGEVMIVSVPFAFQVRSLQGLVELETELARRTARWAQVKQLKSEKLSPCTRGNLEQSNACASTTCLGHCQPARSYFLKRQRPAPY